jgi:hypothetical protein
VLEEIVISRDEYGCDIGQYASEPNPVSPLMRSPHEQDAICGSLDGSMLEECAFAYAVGVDKRLGQVRSEHDRNLCTHTLDNDAAQAVCHEDDWSFL